MELDTCLQEAVRREPAHISAQAAAAAAAIDAHTAGEAWAEALWQPLAAQAQAANPWFTPESIGQAFGALAHMCRPEALLRWLPHLERSAPQRSVGVVAAGNIPMVAFHDILAILISGHRAVVKLSTQDRYLLPALFVQLSQWCGALPLQWVQDRLPPTDAVIATGSNNTARYFEYYFGQKPNIIRRNRSSVAILNGGESDAELAALGVDIFSYFGLGCRSVSKLYLAEDFDLDRLFHALYAHRAIINHHKYANNYDYYRALWMLNREQLLDNGFLILRPSTAIASPVATLFYERYHSADSLGELLSSKADELQCICGEGHTPFGQSQRPELWDYADGVDTLNFLARLTANE